MGVGCVWMWAVMFGCGCELYMDVGCDVWGLCELCMDVGCDVLVWV